MSAKNYLQIPLLFTQDVELGGVSWKLIYPEEYDNFIKVVERKTHEEYEKKYKKLKKIDKDLNNLIINLNRQFLHAKVLGFTHPKTEKYVEFESVLPNNLNSILKITGEKNTVNVEKFTAMLPGKGNIEINDNNKDKGDQLKVDVLINGKDLSELLSIIGIKPAKVSEG